MKTKKPARSKATKSGSANEHERQMDKSTNAPRDLASEDRGVPRGDWNDDPLATEDDDRDVRTDPDAHNQDRGRKRNTT